MGRPRPLGTKASLACAAAFAIVQLGTPLAAAGEREYAYQADSGETLTLFVKTSQGEAVKVTGAIIDGYNFDCDPSLNPYSHDFEDESRVKNNRTFSVLDPADGYEAEGHMINVSGKFRSHGRKVVGTVNFFDNQNAPPGPCDNLVESFPFVAKKA